MSGDTNAMGKGLDNNIVKKIEAETPHGDPTKPQQHRKSPQHRQNGGRNLANLP